MSRKKSKVNKEELCEEVCFHCKDGGRLLICDYKSCLKAYHLDCVGKDESFADTARRWNCKWHSCFMCSKAAKFQCFCCPQAVCGRCLCDSEFAVIRVDGGLCNHCLKLVVLIEQDLDADSDGVRVDFKDVNTVEYLFKDYWQIIKEKEHLSTEHVYSAKQMLKKGKNYSYDFDSNVIRKKEEKYSVSDEESDLQVSDYDGVESGEEYMPVAKKKRSKGKQCTVKRIVEAKKREYIGWGSKSLLEFLASMGIDTSKELSQYEVTSMITDYCKEKKLFDTEKNKKVICDATLQSLLGRKSFNKNSTYNLLTSHFADNLEESTEGDDSESSSEDNGQIFMSTAKRKISLSPKVPDVQKSCFVSIIPENIKLVYLKRSLVEELLKQPETFGEKVTGSFVRVRSDPNDYSQKNSYQLLQIKGIKEFLRNDGEDTEILLQFFRTFKELPVSKLSDDDFCKEECEDLHQRVKDGRLKKPTVVELEQKARSLHENITKHWLARELTLLQKHIDLANEKGWRRELDVYMDKKLLLETPSEQSRLLNEIPEVIAAIEKCDPILEHTQSQDKEGYDGSSGSAPRESPQTHGTALANGTSRHANGRIDPAGSQLDLKGAATKHKRKQVPLNSERSSSMDGLNGDHERDLGDSKDIDLGGEKEQAPSNLGRSSSMEGLNGDHERDLGDSKDRDLGGEKEQAPSNLGRSSSMEGSNGDHERDLGNSKDRDLGGPAAKRKREQAPSNFGRSSSMEGSNGDHERDLRDSKNRPRTEKVPTVQKCTQSPCVIPSGQEAAPVEPKVARLERMNCESTFEVKVIELSDDDEDVTVSGTTPAHEIPVSDLWYCMSPLGVVKGPYKMSLLKLWDTSNDTELRYKVWREGQSKDEAIFLSDALHGNFSLCRDASKV